MDNLLFDIRSPDKIVKRVMVIPRRRLPSLLLGYAWKSRSGSRGIPARFGVEYALWEAFDAAHQRARFDFTMKIPAEYLARTVEIALMDNMQHDGADFALSQASWSQAVEESNFIAALEELRIIFVDEAAYGS